MLVSRWVFVLVPSLEIELVLVLDSEMEIGLV